MWCVGLGGCVMCGLGGCVMCEARWLCDVWG